MNVYSLQLMVLQAGSYFVVPIIIYCCYTLHFVDNAFVTALTGNWRLLWTWNSSLISAWFQCSKAAGQISFHVWIWRRKVSVRQVVESIWWVTFDFQTSLSVIILWSLRFSGKQHLDCIRYYLLVFMVSGLFPQIDIIGAVVIVWRARRKIIRSVLCNTVCNNCTQWTAHTYEQN